MKIERLRKSDRFADCCECCGNDIGQGDTFFRIEDREGNVYIYCPECAAVYLAETLDAVSKEYEWEDDVTGN